MPETGRISAVVATMLSPAVMISCCGLLLLSLVPKLGRVLDRIRALNQEKLGIARKTSLDETDHDRLESLVEQTRMYGYRAKLLKTSSGFTLLAILFFVVTSFTIGIEFVARVNIGVLELIAFLVGMVLVLVSVGFFYWETRTSECTIREEIETSDEMMDKLLWKLGVRERSGR